MGEFPQAIHIGRSHHTLLSPQSMITADELIMWTIEKLVKQINFIKIIQCND